MWEFRNVTGFPIQIVPVSKFPNPRFPDPTQPCRGTSLDTNLLGWAGARARGSAKEGVVDERSRVLLATMIGAVVGGVWGWLYMTQQGARIRTQIEPKLDDFVRELASVRGTVEKARTAANEGWRSLNDITGGSGGTGGTQGRWSAKGA
jgi:hypothetical protein